MAPTDALPVRQQTGVLGLNGRRRRKRTIDATRQARRDGDRVIVLLDLQAQLLGLPSLATLA
jgi:hypothetical protein